MAFNQIQFQRSISIPEFLRRFGTEAQCPEAIKAARWPEDFAVRAAPAMWSATVSTSSSSANGCRHQASLTAGSLMAYTKLRLTT